jgi:hypothetical protein
VDAPRSSQSDRQERNLLGVRVAILPDLVSGRFLEDSIGLVRMTQMPMSATLIASWRIACTDEIMALGDIEQISLLREADVGNLDVGPTLTLTGEHILHAGGVSATGRTL